MILLIIGILLCVGLAVLASKLICERYKLLKTVDDPLYHHDLVVDNKFLRHKGSAYDRAMLRHRLPRKYYV